MGDPSARLLMSLRWDTAHSPQSVLLGRRSLRGIVFFPRASGWRKVVRKEMPDESGPECPQASIQRHCALLPHESRWSVAGSVDWCTAAR